MNKTEKIINNYTFRKHDGFWLANLKFNHIESSIEIFKETLDEGLLNKIISELEGKVVKLDKEGCHLLNVLSESFWGHDKNNIFVFSGFMIDSITENMFIDFRLCYHCGGEDNFSDYANWFIDVKDFRIVGCSRKQL
jgi:hypothetical protein